MRAVIFGGSGQDGHYLDEHLKEIGVQSVKAGARVDHPYDVNVIVRSVEPDWIFQLAAKSTTEHGAILDNHAAIGSGTLHVLEAVRLYAPDAKVLVVGSAAQFQNISQPIDERAPFASTTSYALQRNYAVEMARYYRRDFGLRVYVAYLFNHDSPMRSRQHLAQRIALAARSNYNPNLLQRLTLGGLGMEREWSFAGDVARALAVLVRQDAVTEAVVGSGKAYSVRDWCEACFEAAGLDWRNYVDENAAYRPEYQRLVSDPSTIFGLGYRPTVSFEQLAKMMVNGGR